MAGSLFEGKLLTKLSYSGNSLTNWIKIELRLIISFTPFRDNLETPFFSPRISDNHSRQALRAASTIRSILSQSEQMTE